MINLKYRRVLITIMAAIFAMAFGSACKQADPHKQIMLRNAWVRPAAGMSAGYLRIENLTTRPDFLESASSPDAGKVELHTTINDNHVMKMRPLNWVRIAAGGKQELKPGGVHLMLMNLKKEFKVGDTVELKLKFRLAGEKSVTATVKANRYE